MKKELVPGTTLTRVSGTYLELISDEPRGYNQARDDCIERGGKLASLPNEADRMKIRREIDDIPEPADGKNVTYENDSFGPKALLKKDPRMPNGCKYVRTAWPLHVEREDLKSMT